MSDKTLILISSAILIALIAATIFYFKNISHQEKGDGLRLARVENLTVTLNELKEESLVNYFSLW